MSAFGDFLAPFLGGSVAATGADTARLSQDRTVAVPPSPAAEDETERWRRTDRAREIELRILMSNWM
jgi:hypothetical protein